MKLYFKDCHNKKRLIAEPATEDAAMDEIRKFCSDRHFKIYYVRTWMADGVKIYDVGSHTEFFHLHKD